ncbi:MAG: formylmethanofuran dehydrogenase [Methanophagales archaeon]|nr:formylmethanofuran dehydrogenase [Methanophagales archaeon]
MVKNMNKEKSELEKAIEFSGYLCPRVVFGVRASELGLERLGAQKLGDDEIVAIVENVSCMVDGIQSASGCTLGKGNLVVKNYGKMAVTFINQETRDAFRLMVKRKVLEDLQNSDLVKAKDEGRLPQEEITKMAEEVSQQMMELPGEELFDIKKVHIEAPTFKRILDSVRCTICGEYFGEEFGRDKDGKIVCIPCFEGDGR